MVYTTLSSSILQVCRIEVSEGETGTESESETESEPHSDSVQELKPFPVSSSRIEDMERSRRVSAKEINDVLSQIRKATEVCGCFNYFGHFM